MTDPSRDDFEAKLRETMKKELRRSILATRSILPASARAVRDEAIAERVRALPEFARARVVAGYVATRGECDPRAVLDAALERGATVVLPRVDLAAQRIDWKRTHADRPLVHGAFGILEPSADAETIDPSTIDLVLVPGVGYDVAGHRLGFGKGFYDRALPAMPGALRVGLGFDFQLVSELPVEAHDVDMHLVVTDARTIDVRSD